MLTSTATPVAFAGTAFSADAPVAGLPSGAPPAAQRPEPRLPTPAAWPFPESFPRTSGTGRLDAGASYWSDFLDDDHGAQGSTVAPPASGLAPSKGTYVYPALVRLDGRSVASATGNGVAHILMAAGRHAVDFG
jgi:hypothetical protein